nr:phospholipase-like protein [Tanacetum cinerariifolium]
MEDAIKVLDVKITISSTLSFLTDVKNKLQEPKNENRKTLFRATVFGKWLDILAFENDNNLLNYIFHHQIFILEIFPNSKYWWKTDSAVIPRAFAPSDYESVQPWCVDSFKYFNNLDEPGPRDSVGDVLVEVVEPKHKLMFFGGDNVVKQEPKQVDSNNHSDVHAKGQDSPFQNMDMDANIHSDVHVEEQNSLVMDKEDLLAVFNGIKATVHIIDKRKGDVATSCIVKELDLVKDKITVIEKALKLRYQESFEDSVQQLCYKQHELGGSKGSVGFDNVLDLGCKDEFGNDNDQEGLVKLVDDFCIIEHISDNVVDAKVVDEKVLDDKVLDEKVLDAKVVDEKGQAISRHTATEDQQPPSDHQVYA